MKHKNRTLLGRLLTLLAVTAVPACDSDKPGTCAERFPGREGSGGGGTMAAQDRRACYTPSASEQAAGCLPASSPTLLQNGYLNHPISGAGFSVAAVIGEATVYSRACAALAECCPKLTGDLGISCPRVVADKDEARCGDYLDETPVCGAPPASDGSSPITCCYDTCSNLVSQGRPILVSGTARLAGLARRPEWQEQG